MINIDQYEIYHGLYTFILIHIIIPKQINKEENRKRTFTEEEKSFSIEYKR